MFRVDFSSSRSFRSSWLAGVALVAALATGFGGVFAGEANAAGKTKYKSGGYSISAGNPGRVTSRRTSGRRYGQRRIRAKRSRYGRHYGLHHRYKPSRHLFVGRSLKDVRSSGVKLGRHKAYRHHGGKKYENRHRGHGSLVIRNTNGTRTVSNYNSYYDGQYSQSASVNGVSIYEECPQNFKCGLRAYEDDTGPRVISNDQGTYAADGKLGIETIGPPRVITDMNQVN